MIVSPPESMVTRTGFLSFMLRGSFSFANFLMSSTALSCAPILTASLRLEQRASEIIFTTVLKLMIWTLQLQPIAYSNLVCEWLRQALPLIMWLSATWTTWTVPTLYTYLEVGKRIDQLQFTNTTWVLQPTFSVVVTKLTTTFPQITLVKFD